MKAGIAYATEDRRKEGFVPFMSIKQNLVLPLYPWIQKLGRINKKKENKISKEYIDALNIKTTSQDKNVLELSGGNQQKVSLGKWLALKPKLLILDEPTRGIDIGAKAEIHSIIARIANEGVAVVLISSELPELLGCVDRLIVLREGEITAEFSADEATQDKIMMKAAHVTV